MTTVSSHSADGSGLSLQDEGSLAKTPLAEVLRRAAAQERSGNLEIQGPSFVKTIYFDRGSLVFASSNRKADRLGESMIEAGRISRHEFALASMLTKSTNQRFGEVLVEAGIATEEEIGRYVAAQVNRIVLSLFLEKQGSYRFVEGPCSIPMELMVSLSIYRILTEGVRRMSRKSLVLMGLPPLETEMRIVDQPPFTLDVDKLLPAEESVLRAAKNGATLRDLVEIVGGHEGVALRACYGLMCGGILEPVEPDPNRRLLQVQEETGTFVLSEIRRKVEAPHESVAEPPAPSPPVATAVARKPSPPSEPEPSFEATSDGVTLGDVLEWLLSLWSTVVGWFGGSRGVERAAPARTPSPERRARSVDVAEAPPAAETPSSPAAEATPVDHIGVPSWSQKDDPAEPADEEAAPESLGAPTWSLKSDAADDAGSVGVPPWSLRDAPGASPLEDPAPAPPPQAPLSGMLEPPAWSIMDAPEPPPEPPEDELLDTSQSLDVDLDTEDEPLAGMDSELFIEGESAGDELSMLRQIPVEQVEISQDFEIEVDVELGLDVQEVEEPREEPSELPEERSQSSFRPFRGPLEGSAPSDPPTPTPETSSSASAAAGPPVRPATANDYEPPDADRKEPSHEKEMRRMKQSGGESRLLRDVKLHFKMRDWQGAVPLLEQLVAISPGKALYRGMLARAMSRDPARRKDAEEHFIEALRLSPRDPELHYWLGLYYKSFGLASRATAEFRTTLRINPKHEGARKQLGGGKKDDALGGVLKKLFG